jgi:hypothetical protein
MTMLADQLHLAGLGGRNEASNVGRFNPTAMTEAAAPERHTIAPQRSILVQLKTTTVTTSARKTKCTARKNREG